MQKVELKPKQIFWPKKLRNVGNPREAFYLKCFLHLSLQPKIACGWRLAISWRFSHVRGVQKSFSISLKMTGPLNRCDQTRVSIHTWPIDSVQRQLRQSVLTKRPCWEIYLVYMQNRKMTGHLFNTKTNNLIIDNCVTLFANLKLKHILIKTQTLIKYSLNMLSPT